MRLGRLEVPRAVVVILVAAVVAAVVATIVLFALDDDNDHAGGASAAALDRPGELSGFLQATGPAVVTVSSFDYRDLPTALSAGLAVTGGAYRTAYRTALSGDAAAETVREKAVQSFDLLQVGVGDITGSGARASVLVFGVQHVNGTGGSSDEPVTLTATVVRTAGRYLITELAEDTNAGLPPGSAGLRQAAEAARREIDNLLSYRRAHFAADSRRALDGAGGALRSQLADRSKGLQRSLQRGGYDLDGAVTAVAVNSVRADSVMMLVAATGERVGAGGKRSVVTDGRYSVQVQRTGGRWLVTGIRSYGAQA